MTRDIKFQKTRFIRFPPRKFALCPCFLHLVPDFSPMHLEFIKILNVSRNCSLICLSAGFIKAKKCSTREKTKKTITPVQLANRLIAEIPSKTFLQTCTLYNLTFEYIKHPIPVLVIFCLRNLIEIFYVCAKNDCNNNF